MCLNSLLTVLALLAGCGTNTIDASQTPQKNPPTPDKPERPSQGTVVETAESYLNFTVGKDGKIKNNVIVPYLNLTVPAASSITPTSFLSASAGSTLQTEEFGYFNVKMKNNSSAVWAKTDIFLTVRYASAGAQFQDSGSIILTTSMTKPVNGAEAETTNTIPQCSTAGCGTRVYTFCNATVGACAAKPVINKTAGSLSILGDFSVPSGTYNGTLTWELVTTP